MLVTIMLVISNSHLVVRMEMRNVSNFLISNNPSNPHPPSTAYDSEKCEREVYDQSCKGPLCKFRSTSLFHDFTKGKIFIHKTNITI